MPELSFNEIKDWKQFEELVVAYFRSFAELPGSKIVSVKADPPATGQDGGIDIIVDFLMTDFIQEFKRRWVVQCKYHNQAISPSKISDVNIPTLIHSFNACGYLLVCKERPTTKLTELFGRLKEKCSHKYDYMIWTGEEFRGKLLSAPSILHEQFFPRYFNELKSITESSKR
jgi:hypothetical protein